MATEPKSIDRHECKYSVQTQTQTELCLNQQGFFTHSKCRLKEKNRSESETQTSPYEKRSEKILSEPERLFIDLCGEIVIFTAAGVRTIQENVKKQNRVRHIYYDYLV